MTDWDLKVDLSELEVSLMFSINGINIPYIDAAVLKKCYDILIAFGKLCLQKKFALLSIQRFNFK